MLGTIYPQENTFVNNFDPSVYYEETYGLPGKLYYLFGLSHTYESWWFIGLLVMIGTSLVICSLDRVLPLYRALSKQQIRKHLQFIHRQKTVYKHTIEGDAEQWTENVWGTAEDARATVFTGTAPRCLRRKTGLAVGVLILIISVLFCFC